MMFLSRPDECCVELRRPTTLRKIGVIHLAHELSPNWLVSVAVQRFAGGRDFRSTTLRISISGFAPN
jgi:hypothetical protein